MLLLARVRRTIRRHALAGSETGVVAAVSGGSDSVALARLLRELAGAEELRLVGIAHFNHQLRASAVDDEAFCAGFASTLGVPFVSDRADVAARARTERRSVEDAARAARHEFFERARIHFGADVVATGHTRDDQAETFLLRLLRGAGSRGLASMHPRNGTIIRPLLDCRRRELRNYLAGAGVSYQEDETNADVNIPRNRVRAELMPLLESRFNPDVVEVLADAADVAREEWRWLLENADEAFEQICRRDAEGWRLDAARLRQIPLAHARLVAWRAMSQGSGGRPIGFLHVDDLLELGGRDSGAIDLPGQRAQRLGPEIVLRSNPQASIEAMGTFWYPLDVPGEARVPEAGLVVSARPEGSWDEHRGPGCTEKAVVQLGGDRRLAVRNWRPGDRFRPLGMDGRKKLQDFFVDRKIPRAERPLVPIVVDELDRIVWVAGHGIDEEFRVTEPAQPVLVLRLKSLGGPA